MFYTLKAGEAACPWCGAPIKNNMTFSLPMIFKCECGGMWVLTTPPDKLKEKKGK